MTQSDVLNFSEELRDKTKMSEGKKNLDIDLLEEDDEFEEFPTEDWDIRKEDQTDINVWEDSWDDDNTDTDFSNHLRTELESQGNIQEK